jgi:hypothetical protein
MIPLVLAYTILVRVLRVCRSLRGMLCRNPRGPVDQSVLPSAPSVGFIVVLCSVRAWAGMRKRQIFLGDVFY